MDETPAQGYELSAAPVTRAASAHGASSSRTPNTFREKIQSGKFVMTVEVDPPHGLRPQKAPRPASGFAEPAATLPL